MTLIAWLLCALLRPTRVVAPAGWYVNGAAPSGRVEVRPWLGRPERDLDDAHARVTIRDDRLVVLWLWCRAGTSPRQNGLRAWCERDLTPRRPTR